MIITQAISREEDDRDARKCLRCGVTKSYMHAGNWYYTPKLTCNECRISILLAITKRGVKKSEEQ